MSLALGKALQRESSKIDASDEVIARCQSRAKAMLADLKRVNPRQHALVVDPSPHSSGLCPRRAGKSYAGCFAALVTGEAQPGSISIIISLNLKQLKRLYWAGGPSGLFTLARKYNLNLEWAHATLKWTHENGSIGYLLGAEDDEQLEVLRGLEADLYLIDECKSFAPARLAKLITEIIAPQRASRQGRLILIGTPGNVAAGPFYEATCPGVTDQDGKPFSVEAGKKDPHGRTPKKNRIWSRHHWTLQDNTALPHQWDEALISKAENRWADDNPVWRREYLGEWAVSADGSVYRYADARNAGLATWVPTTGDPPLDLPEEGAPWRFIAGMDIGFEDKTAIVVAAYSARLKQLRHVLEFSASHLLIDDVAEKLHEFYDRVAPHSIESIHADTGNLGKMVVETLLRKGFPILAAEKREKYDHIELLNSALMRGEIKIIEGSELHNQLLLGAWDLRKGDRDELAKLGRLREDPAIENDVTDAFLYLYRGSLHQFGWNPAEKPIDPGTPEFFEALKKEQLAKARRQLAQQPDRLGGMRPPHFVMRALESPWNSTQQPSRRFSPP